MMKKILIAIILLMIVLIMMKPVGKIDSYYEFDQASKVEINYIKSSTTDKIVYLNEEETLKVFNQISKRIYLRQMPNIIDLGGYPSYDYYFDMSVDGKNYKIAIRNNRLAIEDNQLKHYFINSKPLNNLLDNLFK